MFLPTNVRRYIAFMRQRGFDADAVLQGSGISMASLDDEAYLVDVAQCQKVVDNMVRLTGRSGLGLESGSASQIPELGIIGHALMSSRTMRQLVMIWIEYSSSLVGSLLRPRLDELEPDGVWTLTIPKSEMPDSIFRFCVEEFFATGLQIGSLVAGRPIVAKAAEVSYARPPHGDSYETALACPVTFGAPQTRITIASPHLGQPLRNNDDLFREICVRHCQQILRQIASRSPMVARLRGTFLQQPGALPGMAEAARRLGLSPRTLRRRLDEEGTTYNELIDQFRRELALEYLRTGHMAPKEVAYLLGFSSPSTFRRAFKVWTDRTVGEFLEHERGVQMSGEESSNAPSMHGSGPRAESAQKSQFSRTP